jgi:hypothetical protein
VSATSQRYRLTLLLFACGVMASAALVASQMTEANAVAAQTDAAPQSVAFDQWVDEDPAPDEHKGKLLGRVERNGELVEVREPVADEGIEPVEENDSEPLADAEQGELAPQ